MSPSKSPAGGSQSQIPPVRPVAAARDAEAARPLVAQRHDVVLGGLQPQRVPDHRVPAPVETRSGSVGDDLVPEHHDRGVGLDRLRRRRRCRSPGRRASGCRRPRAGWRRTARPRRRTAPPRPRAFRPAAAPFALWMSALPRSPAIAAGPTACARARRTAEMHRLALLPVGEHGAVRRQRADARALGDDEVDAAGRPRREPAARVEQVLEGEPRRSSSRRARCSSCTCAPGGTCR